MRRKKIAWTDVAKEFDTETMTSADKQWCLEEAIDIVKARAQSGIEADLAALLRELYEKLLELGADAFSESPRREKKELD